MIFLIKVFDAIMGQAIGFSFGFLICHILLVSTISAKDSTIKSLKSIIKSQKRFISTQEEYINMMDSTLESFAAKLKIILKDDTIEEYTDSEDQ